MDVENILKLINAVSESELTEFNYDEGELHLKLSKKQKQIVVQQENATVMASPMMSAPMMATPAMPMMPQIGSSTVATGDAESSAQVATETAQPEYTGEDVKSPLVGTFYSAPSPDDAPYVKVGDRVKKGQTLGIVEAMKLMNEIESEYDGVVQAILVENEEIVEYGQPLFVIG